MKLDIGNLKLNVPAPDPDEEAVDPRLTGPERADEIWRIRTRRRWAGLTKDLDAYCRDFGGVRPRAEDEDEEAAPEPLCRLDVPSQELEAELAPLRLAALRKVHEQLALYDRSEEFRERQDRHFEIREMFEEHHRHEGVRKIRQTIQRYCTGADGRPLAGRRSVGSWAPPRRDAGQVWRVVGGTKDGGILVRGDFPSKVIGRLSSGSLVEELATSKDRLQYRLLSGSGPATGWVSLVLKANGEEKPLLVKADPQEARVAVEASSRKGPRVLVLMVGLMAVHISTEARLRRLRHVLCSVGRQDVPQSVAEFLFSVSWSASTPELETMVYDVIADFKARRRSGIEVVATRQSERHSQFQHLKAALAAAEENLRLSLQPPQKEQAWESAWVIFGDDDDIWHRQRVAEYVHAIRSHAMLEGVASFATTTRVNCNGAKTFTDADMPCTEEEVDSFVRSGDGTRLDGEEACVLWRRLRDQHYPDESLLPIPSDLPLEYFDFCPRLRLVHEFLERTSVRFLEHKYCDLRMLEFLTVYPSMGQEMGLEVAFFRPRCWMIFYATPVATQQQWERAVEKTDAPTRQDQQQQLRLDVNNGHMSSAFEVQPAEQELADRMCEEFRQYEPQMTPARLARYWSAFRNAMEVFLARKHSLKIDQRTFDVFVFLAINSSFFKFADKIDRMPDRDKAETAERMMYYVGQGFAKAIAMRIGISIAWVRPDIFLGRDLYFAMSGCVAPLLGVNADKKIPVM